MRFPQPLVGGRLIRRYKRFFADVVLDDGREVVAHMPNPGRLLGLDAEGTPVRLSPAVGAGRRLAWTVELMAAETGAWVGVNAGRANALAWEAVAAGAVPELTGYDGCAREVRYDGGRIDLHLTAAERPGCWVEVKSVTLSRQAGLAEWPDCVSSRSSRQLGDMTRLVEAGERAVLLFVAQRCDCERFAPAADLDPKFAAALTAATAAGVEALAYAASVDPEGMSIVRPLRADGPRSISAA